MKKLLALLCAMAFLCGCTLNYGDDKTREALPSPALDQGDYSVETYAVDIADGYFWLLCAADKFYYTVGVQELMDTASKPVPVYAFDPDTGVSEEVAIPYGDTAHLYSMTPDGDGGYWLAMTPLTHGSVVGYTPGPAFLVKTDSDFQELFTIDLTPYTKELVRIVNVTCPRDSDYAREAMDELGYVEVPSENFAKAVLACDDMGRVYVTAYFEDVVMFDQDGNYLGQFNTYDMAYSQGISLTKSGSGSIVVARMDGDLERKLTVLNAEDFTQSEPLLPDPDASGNDRRHCIPLTSLLPEYDLLGQSHFGLYGLNLGSGGAYTTQMLLHWNKTDIPENLNPALLRQTAQGDELVFYYQSPAGEDGSKDYKFFVLTMTK